MSANCIVAKVNPGADRQQGSPMWELVPSTSASGARRKVAPLVCSNRLDSWKEIAVYLQRSIRCVQRWERLEGLPVRRHQHRRGATVYAFAVELDAWLLGRLPLPEIATEQQASD